MIAGWYFNSFLHTQKHQILRCQIQKCSDIFLAVLSILSITQCIPEISTAESFPLLTFQVFFLDLNTLQSTSKLMFYSLTFAKFYLYCITMDKNTIYSAFNRGTMFKYQTMCKMHWYAYILTWHFQLPILTSVPILLSPAYFKHFIYHFPFQMNIILIIKIRQYDWFKMAEL